MQALINMQSTLTTIFVIAMNTLMMGVRIQQEEETGSEVDWEQQ